MNTLSFTRYVFHRFWHSQIRLMKGNLTDLQMLDQWSDWKQADDGAWVSDGLGENDRPELFGPYPCVATATGVWFSRQVYQTFLQPWTESKPPIIKKPIRKGQFIPVFVIFVSGIDAVRLCLIIVCTINTHLPLGFAVLTGQMCGSFCDRWRG